MEELKTRIHDESNGLDYMKCGDYYIPDISLPKVVKRDFIGKWGRMHRDYLRENNSLLFNHLVLTGKLWSYLVDLNEQAQNRLEVIMQQMMETEGVTEDLKRRDQLGWVGAMNSIRNRAEEIVCSELIYA